jgi:hypothetical protein
MSVLSVLGGRDGPTKTVMAEMPVVLQPPARPGKQKSPQEKLDRFWKKFTTEAPGKGLFSLSSPFCCDMVRCDGWC